jgi:hypothetical protein
MDNENHQHNGEISIIQDDRVKKEIQIKALPPDGIVLLAKRHLMASKLQSRLVSGMTLRPFLKAWADNLYLRSATTETHPDRQNF